MSSGPSPSPVGIPMPWREGAKDRLALRGPRREEAMHALPRHPGPTPRTRPALLHLSVFPCRSAERQLVEHRP